MMNSNIVEQMLLNQGDWGRTHQQEEQQKRLMAYMEALKKIESLEDM